LRRIVIDRVTLMRIFLLATTALLLAAQLTVTQPALADYKAAEERLQAGDVPGAMPLLAEEAKLGNPVAAFNLAKIYEDGSGGAQDFSQAATYYKIAAEIDTAPRYNGAALGPQGPELIAAAQKYGQFALGRFYETGKGVPQDSQEAVFWYTRAADLGLQQAMLKLALLYRTGLPGAEGTAGIAADPAQAVVWLEKAATLGNVAAMNELGRAYLAGEGVLANARVAAEWFEKAAATGSLTAEYSLGSIYRIGFGGQPDFIRAARHFERAANGKESASMVALGDLYANGQGVPQDRVQALTWYKLAALYGQPEGGKRGEVLAASMSPEEQAQAKTRAETWVPTGDQPAATSAPAPGVVPTAAAPAPAAPAPAEGVPATTATESVVAPEAAPAVAPAVPAPLPATTPTALEWVPAAPAEPLAPEPAAATAPQPAAQPAAAPDAPPPASTPTATDNPINPATNQPFEPFDPFAPDPFALESLTPNMPGVSQPGTKPIQTTPQP
jgi:TPR repeat protein